MRQKASDPLHQRVRAFIDESARGTSTSETFDGLALEILAFQAGSIPAYARLLARARLHPRDVDTPRVLPAVPTDAFRLVRMAAHPVAEDEVVFRTSGTTSGARGEHPLSTTKTYEEAALAWGRWALFFDHPRAMSAVVLAPPPDDPTIGDSSLHFMMRLFASSFASRVHYVQRAGSAALDLSALREACAQSTASAAPTIVMGTSFAFVHLLDLLGGERMQLGPNSRAMHTGGYKGKSREVEPGELRLQIADTFGIPLAAVVGEYGMTELSSQLYEGSLRGHFGQPVATAERGVFIPPPWLRVVSVHPETLIPLPPGEVGILRFEDLANVDSALIVQTADRGRCDERGCVELLGRLAGAPPRGCSLAIEELLAGP
jgi:hypothetical protein